MRGTDLLQHLLGNLREVDRVRLVLREHTCAARRPVSPPRPARALRSPAAPRSRRGQQPERRTGTRQHALDGVGDHRRLLLYRELVSLLGNELDHLLRLLRLLLRHAGPSCVWPHSQRRLLRLPLLDLPRPIAIDSSEARAKHSQAELCTLQGATLCTYKKRADETLRTCRCGTPPASSRRGERRALCANLARQTRTLHLSWSP